MMNGRGPVNRAVRLCAALLVLACMALAPARARAEDGYRLWLRYAPLQGEPIQRLRAFKPAEFVIDGNQSSETLKVARLELANGLAGMQGYPHLQFRGRPGLIELNCGTAVGTGNSGFAVRSGTRDNRPAIFIAAEDHLGCLYASYALLREVAQGADPSKINISSAPANQLRMIDHWDDPDGLAMRGYAGRSIFDWWRLPGYLDRRMIDYARAEASIGINGVVVNSVNASPLMLTSRYIAKLKRLADAWRPYGIRVYLSARFSAPRDIGGIPTADPLDSRVAAWWKAKADEIYASVPDFGGFLVKANSEGEPGPGDYGRSHAEGANMMAAAIGNRGVVIWRAFVYSAEDATDRAKQAYNEFVPLDGKFAPNVIVQVKNGPIDFQPREPFHPMFGAMPHTRLMFEGQITKEYLGFATHLVFLAPMWKEALDADTGRGGSVADSVRSGGMAGVANTGSDRNWSGSHFDQANWYAFGRLAWDPSLSSEQIAREWAAQTFSRDPDFLAGVAPMMLGSREAAVDYMTPLGLAHQMATHHHYGPGPWICDLARPEWNPCYYNRADKDGIGFDRTASGSNALEQYAPSVAAQWADPHTIDERYLLWFHHVPWDFRMKSGKTLWEELVGHYDHGVAAVAAMGEEWRKLKPFVDEQRWEDENQFLAIQLSEAKWWRDASIAYWQSLNHLSLPDGAAPPEHSLDYYKSLEFPEAPAD